MNWKLCYFVQNFSLIVDFCHIVLVVTVQINFGGTINFFRNVWQFIGRKGDIFCCAAFFQIEFSSKSWYLKTGVYLLFYEVCRSVFVYTYICMA